MKIIANTAALALEAVAAVASPRDDRPARIRGAAAAVRAMGILAESETAQGEVDSLYDKALAAEEPGNRTAFAYGYEAMIDIVF